MYMRIDVSVALFLVASYHLPRSDDILKRHGIAFQHPAAVSAAANKDVHRYEELL